MTWKFQIVTFLLRIENIMRFHSFWILILDFWIIFLYWIIFRWHCVLVLNTLFFKLFILFYFILFYLWQYFFSWYLISIFPPQYLFFLAILLSIQYIYSSYVLSFPSSHVMSFHVVSSTSIPLLYCLELYCYFLSRLI